MRAVIDYNDCGIELRCGFLLPRLLPACSATSSAAAGFSRFFVVRTDKLDYGHLRRVAATNADLDDARVAAGAVFKARPDGVEQFSHHGFILHNAERLAARV